MRYSVKRIAMAIALAAMSGIGFGCELNQSAVPVDEGRIATLETEPLVVENTQPESVERPVETPEAGLTPENVHQKESAREDIDIQRAISYKLPKGWSLEETSTNYLKMGIGDDETRRAEVEMWLFDDSVDVKAFAQEAWTNLKLQWFDWSHTLRREDVPAWYFSFDGGHASIGGIAWYENGYGVYVSYFTSGHDFDYVDFVNTIEFKE